MTNETPSGDLATASDLTDLTISEAFTRAAVPRRVLIYAPMAYSTPHFETDLEIAQRHLDLGDTVELVLCDGELRSCQLNPEHDLKRCLECVSRNLQGAAQLSTPVPIITLSRFLADEDHAALAKISGRFKDQAELRNYRFENFDAGMATLSSLIDFTRSPVVEPAPYVKFVHASLYGSILTFLGLKRVFAANRYDRVYIYNGRWNMMRSAVRACERAGVEYYTHERGADFLKFAMCRNTLPHDKAAFRERVKAAWAQARGHATAVPLASDFYEAKRRRVEKTWFSFVKDQELGRVPADWDRGSRRIVYFTSSEYECAAIVDETKERIYPSQVEGLPRMARRLAKASPGSHLWVRVHPNENTPETVEKWERACAPFTNVTLIRPDEKIDSYAMLDGADRVLTFGSTIGIEATYWGKPSICAEDGFYNGLGALYEPGSENELIELLSRENLPAKPREDALNVGYYFNTYGDEFRHFSTDKISDFKFESPFRGRCLKPDYDDLRRRLHALYTEGELTRAANIAHLCAEFLPSDTMAHTIRLLAMIRLGLSEPAVGALEKAAAALPEAGLATVLKGVAKPFLDVLMTMTQPVPAPAFSPLARRVGEVMLRVPEFALIGRNLVGLANKSREAARPPGAARVAV